MSEYVPTTLVWSSLPKCLYLFIAIHKYQILFYSVHTIGVVSSKHVKRGSRAFMYYILLH